uniref:Uncharacterized protein n=1 Tax=Arundo donax TaxID=35708 RepID=A0A0A9BCH2_ARUDO
MSLTRYYLRLPLSTLAFPI